MTQNILTVALMTMGLALTACGQDSETDLEKLNMQLDTAELGIRSPDGGQRAEACLDYASICERVASICLWAEGGHVVARCDVTTDRCDRNLAQYCDGRRRQPRPDGGVDSHMPGDASVGDSWMADDAWRGDASVGDSWMADDAWRGDASVGDAWMADDAWGDATKSCIVSGCSGQVCAARTMYTTCEWLPEYACYRLSTCERQRDGDCDWSPNEAFTDCLDAARRSD